MVWATNTWSVGLARCCRCRFDPHSCSFSFSKSEQKVYFSFFNVQLLATELYSKFKLHRKFPVKLQFSCLICLSICSYVSSLYCSCPPLPVLHFVFNRFRDLNVGDISARLLWSLLLQDMKEMILSEFGLLFVFYLLRLCFLPLAIDEWSKVASKCGVLVFFFNSFLFFFFTISDYHFSLYIYLSINLSIDLSVSLSLPSLSFLPFHFNLAFIFSLSNWKEVNRVRI